MSQAVSLPALTLIWMGSMSILCFLAMGLDKLKAKKNRRRIRERTLFLLALLGGAAGGMLGMQLFRHKTRHASFKIGMPLLLALNLACLFAAVYFSRPDAAASAYAYILH